MTVARFLRSGSLDQKTRFHAPNLTYLMRRIGFELTVSQLAFDA
jgi:hypothetical protein